MLGIDQSLPSLLQTAPCEDSCPGITFEVSELNFDEESNCSNEEGGEAAEEEENICSNEEGEEEEERIDNADSDWELEQSDKLESDDSDQLESDDHDQLESDDSDSELHRSVRQLVQIAVPFTLRLRLTHASIKSSQFPATFVVRNAWTKVP